MHTTKTKKMWCGVSEARVINKISRFYKILRYKRNCNRKIHQRIRITYQPQHAKQEKGPETMAFWRLDV
jgi:hypothetical protein